MSPRELRLFRRLASANERAMTIVEALTRELVAARSEVSFLRARVDGIVRANPRSIVEISAEMGQDSRAVYRFLRSSTDRRPHESARVREALTRWWMGNSSTPEHELLSLTDKAFATAFLASGLCQATRRKKTS